MPFGFANLVDNAAARSRSSFKPKVVHVTDCYTGGVRTHLDLLAANLEAPNQELVILGGSIPDGSPFARIHTVPFNRWNPFSWRSAARAIGNRSGGALLHGHSTFGGWVAAQATHGACVYTPHAHFLMIPGGLATYVIKKLLLRHERKILPNHSVILACGIEEYDILHAAYPELDVRLILHGWPAEPRRSEGARDIDYLFLGRLTKQKNPLAFIRYVSNKQGKKVMVGRGPLERRCRREAKKQKQSNIEMVSYVPDVKPYLNRAKKLVLSSTYEGNAYVVHEALAHGCEIVSISQGPGMTELAFRHNPSLQTNMTLISEAYGGAWRAAKSGTSA